MEDQEITELKLKINNLIWMHSVELLSLAEAEIMSIDILEMITKGKLADTLAKEREAF